MQLSICISVGFHSPRRPHFTESAYGFRVLIFLTKSIFSRKYFMSTDSAWYRKPWTSSSWRKLNFHRYRSSTRSLVFHSRTDERFLSNIWMLETGWNRVIHRITSSNYATLFQSRWFWRV
jgi:hypothetical protein